MPEAPASHRRLHGITALFAMVLCGLAVRLVHVQGIDPLHAGPAEDAQQTVSLAARRGSIRDLHDNLLAHSRFVHDLKVDPVLLGPHAAEFARFAAPLLGLPEHDAVARFTPEVETRTRKEVTRDAHGRSVTNEVSFLFTNRSVRLNLRVESAEWARIRSQIRTNFQLSARVEASRDLAAVASAAPGLTGKLRLAASGDFATLGRFKSALKEARRRRDELRLQELEMRVNGITAQEVEIRVYPLGGLAAHVLGHTREEDAPAAPGLPPRLRGVMGIEWQFDEEFQGVPGIRVIRTAKGRELTFLRESDIPPRNGLDVQLTLDARIQMSLERALDAGVERLSPKGISCVVMRPRTGEIVAMGSRPTFDPNRFQDYPDDWRKNRPLVDPIEPGSTFKIVTYSAAFDLGLATPDTPVDCEGGIWSPPSGRPVRDVEGHGLGLVTVEEAFAKSSNVAAAKYGLKIPLPVFREYARRMGYFQRTGLFFRESKGADGGRVVRYGAEDPGAFPSVRRINTELHGRLSYGYGLYATPLQIAAAMSTIANGGVYMRPHLVRRLTTPAGAVVREFAPERVGQAMRPETAEQMRRMLRRVVTDGTGRRAALEDFDVAGKTGTAHKFVNKRQSNERYTSTFVGYLPAGDPELCIVVVVDEPRKRGAGSYYGGTACGPIFQQIAREAAAFLALPPSTEEFAEDLTTGRMVTGTGRGG